MNFLCFLWERHLAAMLSRLEAYSAEVALATKAGSRSHKKFSFEMLPLEMKVFQGVHPWNR